MQRRDAVAALHDEGREAVPREIACGDEAVAPAPITTASYVFMIASSQGQ
jgi:hypothetical protein